MLYMGGKGRLGRHLCEQVLANTNRRRRYVEPFLGGGNFYKHIASHFAEVYVGDIHKDLMLMWNAAALGWTPPGAVSEAEYKRVRASEPSPLRGFVGFGCSFGGKWWGGYARSQCNGDDYYARHAAKSVLEISKILPPNVRGALCRQSYEAWTALIADDCVVYADPPYAKTTGYKGGFDHGEFWRVMTHWSDIGAHVFVSEYVAPLGWRSIWMKEQRRKVSGGTGDMTQEHLFVREST
jgi:DNA adenine methylase